MANIFNNIDTKNKYKLLKSLRADIYSFEKDKSIINTIIDDNTICLIIKGSIKIIRNNDNGSTTIFDKLNENDIFGSTIYNLNDDDYDVITSDDTQIIIINYNDIIKYRNNNRYYNDFIKNLLIIYNDKIKEFNERINILSKKSIRNKLLEFFNLSFTKNNSRNIYLPFTFTELADYLAVDRSAMTRELKVLKDEGFIRITGKRITLLYK